MNKTMIAAALAAGVMFGYSGRGRRRIFVSAG
jgi:hypothetical protein